MNHKKINYVKGYLAPESPVSYIWIAESSKCLQRPDQMEFLSRASAEKHKSGVIEFTRSSNHRKFGRSVRAFVAQRASYKCKRRIDGAPDMFGATLFRRHNPTPIHTKLLLEQADRLINRNKK